MTYTLDIPAGAVFSPLEISLTPVISMGNAPTAAGLLGAVRMEPAGINFIKPAELRISANAPGGARTHLVGFTSDNDGSSFNLRVTNPEGADFALDVKHFSIAGVSAATQAELSELALADVERPESSTADEKAARIALLLDSGASPDQLGEVLQRWYAQHVQPRIENAAGNSDAGDDSLAVTQYQEWLRQRDRVIEAALASGQSFDPDGLNSVLAVQDAHAEANMPQIYSALVTGELAACQQLHSLAAVAGADAWQRLAEGTNLPLADVRLTRPLFMKDVADCVTVEQEPIELPSPIPSSGDAPINARAGVRFFRESQTQAASFEFEVTTTRGTVREPVGPSDPQGRYSTSLSTDTREVQVTANACLVLPENGVSDFCVARVAGAQGAVVRELARWSMSAPPLAASGRETASPVIFDQEQSSAQNRGHVGITANNLALTGMNGAMRESASCVVDGGAEILWQIEFNITTNKTFAYTVVPTYDGPIGANFGQLQVNVGATGTSIKLLNDLQTSQGVITSLQRAVALPPGEYVFFVASTVTCDGASAVMDVAVDTSLQ